jgi:hypothetical protein
MQLLRSREKPLGCGSSRSALRDSGLWNATPDGVGRKIVRRDSQRD